MPLLILGLILCLEARAWNPAEAQRFQDSFAHLREVFGKVDREAPPCAGLRLFHEEMAQYAPPARCPEAHSYFSRVGGFLNHAVENCQEVSRFVESRIRGRSHCEGDQPNALTWQTMTALKTPLDNDATNADQGTPLDFDTIAEKGGPGEYRHAACALGLGIAANSRRKASGLLNRFYGISNYTIAESCGPKRREISEDYSRFLERGGEN